MLKTELEEAVNGWIVTINLDGNIQKFVYETLQAAQEHLGGEESRYDEKFKKGVKDNAFTL